jgi:hypothetical protein
VLVIIFGPSVAFEADYVIAFQYHWFFTVVAEASLLQDEVSHDLLPSNIVARINIVT